MPQGKARATSTGHTYVARRKRVPDAGLCDADNNINNNVNNTMLTQMRKATAYHAPGDGERGQASVDISFVI